MKKRSDIRRTQGGGGERKRGVSVTNLFFEVGRENSICAKRDRVPSKKKKRKVDHLGFIVSKCIFLKKGDKEDAQSV